MDVRSKTDTEILDIVKEEIGKDLTDEERSKLQFRMDTDSTKSYIAAVIEFGVSGAVIMNGKIEIGHGSPKELYFTSRVIKMSGNPQMHYIHKE
ncbi:hypothetical protein VTK26DRAFT_3754 [Humicola hyalothermophila]